MGRLGIDQVNGDAAGVGTKRCWIHVTGPLIDYDRHNDCVLIRTLRAFFDAYCSHRIAAERLSSITGPCVTGSNAPNRNHLTPVHAGHPGLIAPQNPSDIFS